MVYVMLAEGFEEIEALAVVDILRRGDVPVKTVSVYNHECVTGAHGITVVPDIKFNDIDDDIDDDIEMVILPGGIPGTPNLQANKQLEALLKNCFEREVYIAAICAAPMILGQLKFLQSKKATCYPSFEKHLIDAKISDDKVCVDGKIITSRGAGTAHDLAFELLEILRSAERAKEIRSSMLYD